MDEKIVEKLQNQRERYQNFLKAMNCCPLCSAPLILIHEVYEKDYTIKETAHCEQCEMQTRCKDHICH